MYLIGNFHNINCTDIIEAFVDDNDTEIMCPVRIVNKTFVVIRITQDTGRIYDYNYYAFLMIYFIGNCHNIDCKDNIESLVDDNDSVMGIAIF